MPLKDHAVERHFLTRFYHNGLTGLHLVGCHGLHFTLPLHMGRIGTYVHQVRYAVAALALGIALKEFAHLEEEHHEHRFGKLILRSRQESYGQCAECGHRHKEVLVEGIAVGQSLGGLPQGVVAYEQIGHKIDQQQLPGGQTASLLHYDRGYEEQRGGRYKQHLAPQTALFVMMVMVVVMVMMMLMFMVMMVMVMMMGVLLLTAARL